MISYEVEQYFYQNIAPRLPKDVAVAHCLASTSALPDGTPTTATILTDLRPQFPIAGEKRAVLSDTQVLSALDWLARFHAASWSWLPDHNLDAYALPPLEEAELERDQTRKLWLNGGYTYLATRKSEFASLARSRQSEWKAVLCEPQSATGSSIADMVATYLTPSGRPFETCIHGDVKSENLFTTQSGDAVAFYDFQYVGLGLGACDLAKLSTCSIPIHMLTEHDEYDIPDRLEMDDGEKRILERYLSVLLARRPKGRGPKTYDWDTFVRHWETALVDWCRFQASWGFWGNTEWLEARTRCILADEEWRRWLEEEVTAIHAKPA